MKLSIGKSVPIALVIATALGFTIHLRKAEAWRGGYGGGSFRGDDYAEGPRGGQAVETPRGGEAAQGPQGTEAVEGPRGNEAAEGPRGGEAMQGPGGDTAVRGPQGNVAVGDRVTALPAESNRVIVSGQTYYVAGGVYYMPFYYGGDITYVVVENPND